MLKLTPRVQYSKKLSYFYWKFIEIKIQIKMNENCICLRCTIFALSKFINLTICVQQHIKHFLKKKILIFLENIYFKNTKYLYATKCFCLISFFLGYQGVKICPQKKQWSYGERGTLVHKYNM